MDVEDNLGVWHEADSEIDQWGQGDFRAWAGDSGSDEESLPACG